ncbi:DUF1365 family protein [Sulfitobacter pontiacus]|uniref:DUF1365 family protein n=1 Tax=Sulfitobacter pontiacus TaxID=60137 RepID=UPI0032649CD0
MTHGAIRNAFSYGGDYVLIDLEARAKTPMLFSRNRFNLVSIYDRDHGGPLKVGCGTSWARKVLAADGLCVSQVQILLLTQLRFLGYGGNPSLGCGQFVPMDRGLLTLCTRGGRMSFDTGETHTLCRRIHEHLAWQQPRTCS